MFRSRCAILRWAKFVLAAWMLGIVMGLVSGCVAVGDGHQSAAAAAHHPIGMTDDGTNTPAKRAGCATLCQKSTIGAPETRFDDSGTTTVVHAVIADTRLALATVSFVSPRMVLRHGPLSLRGSPPLRTAYRRLAL